ncbi:MAG TPA: hypothetical protein VGE52_12840 [Pirellulales bacterium]
MSKSSHAHQQTREQLDEPIGRRVRTTKRLKSLRGLAVPIGSTAKVVERDHRTYTLIAVPPGLHFFCPRVPRNAFEVIEESRP